jgi:UDP-2,3-diacylglucosamine pyrophosphatase LpxH
MHKQLLGYLSRVADIYLVSRLKNQRLGFPSKNDIRIFFPDIHLLSRERNKDFKYGTSYPDLLAKVARELKNFRNEMTDDKTSSIYQLGDFLDLWRETPEYWSVGGTSDRWEASVQQILDDNVAIINSLRDPDLGTKFILGNHDYDLHWLPSFAEWRLRYYFPLDQSDLSKGASAVALHGDIFSGLEKKIPDWLQYLAVNLFGPAVTKPKPRDLGELRDVIIKDHSKSLYTDYIQQPAPSDFKDLFPAQSRSLPGRYNVSEKGTGNEKELEYLKEAKDFCSGINEDFKWNIQLAFIGHTHNARIAVDETEGQFFALVDCGAWIEQCKGLLEDQEKVMDCAQIGVLSDNDARIYQLVPKEG